MQTQKLLTIHNAFIFFDISLFIIILAVATSVVSKVILKVGVAAVCCLQYLPTVN